MIAALFNIPTDEITMSRFSFHNRDAHELATDAIFRNTGVTLPLYPIDPIPPDDFPGWLYTHQSMHNSINAALGLTGNDLTDMDPRQLDQLANWIQLHAAEHVTWGNMLGIG